MSFCPILKKNNRYLIIEIDLIEWKTTHELQYQT